MSNINEITVKINVDSENAIKKIDEIIAKIKELNEALQNLFSFEVK